MEVGDGLDNDCDGKVDEEICGDFTGKQIMSVDWWLAVVCAKIYFICVCI